MKRILFVLFFLFVSFLFLSPHKVFAEKINSFDVSVTAHKDGTILVKEDLSYDFKDSERHGIYRYIPLYSKVGDLYRIIKIENVSVERDGNSENFETTKNKEQIYFKIGNADKTISGPHEYVISYTVENAIGSNFPDHDEIYWNATGNDWEVTIEKASIRITNDFGAKQTSLICFEGAVEAKDKSCNVDDSKATSGQTLYPEYGLTAVAVYPKGTFPLSYLSKEPPKTFGDRVGEFVIKHIFTIWLLLNIVLPAGIIFWYQKHKNKTRFGKPAVNFDIPKDEKGNRLAPVLAGTIDNAKLERDDVVATIFDLAIRKYIKLEETKSVKKLLPDSITQTITKLKDADGTFENFEKSLFDRLFEDGDSVKTNELKSDFYITYQDMESKIFQTLVEKKYYVRNPKVQRGFLFIAGLVSLFTFNIILAAVLFFLSNKLIGRTSLGDEIDYRIDGLKLFLKSMDRNYNWQAEKFYTVEQMIPYAMALGYIDKFMEQLKLIKPDYHPTWYGGYSGNFYGSYGAFYSSVSSSMTTSAPSSSSGSSGGFSGGGGGGGGGGSW